MPKASAHLAVVTGSSGGLGHAIAERLGADGYRLALIDIESDGPAFEAASVQRYCCDLVDPSAIEGLVEDIRQRQGDPSILVNNAGVFPTVPFANLNMEIWREVFAVNLDAPMLLSRLLAPAMCDAGWGRIVNIASSVTQIVRRDVAPYVASKMGLIGLTRALASDLGPHGVTVNAVSPGLVKTKGVEAKFDREDATGIFEAIAARQAIPDPVLPEDIANAVAMLVAEGAGKITGQSVIVDGGLSRI